jgi:hypothetical protein
MNGEIPMLAQIHSRLGTALALAALAACSHNPAPASPEPQPAPPVRVLLPQPAAPAPVAAPAPAPAAAPAPARFELLGEWDWNATLGDEAYSGTMTLQSQGAGFTGFMRVAGQFDATVRSAVVTGNAARVIFDSPQGEMVLDALFTDANTLAGRVEVSAMGAVASFSAHRK